MVEMVNGAYASNDATSPLGALENFYEAFNQRDANTASHAWLNTERVAMYNPIGGIKRGWEQIKDTYSRIMQGNIHVYVEFYDYTLQQHDTLFYVFGRERGYAKCAGQQIELAIRTSRVFEWHTEQWRQVHHHGSIDNPTLLDAYQTLLKN